MYVRQAPAAFLEGVKSLLDLGQRSRCHRKISSRS
jgi:hypothetical protein